MYVTIHVQGELKVPTKSRGILRISWDNFGAPWRLERRLNYNISLFYPGSIVLVNETKAVAREDLRSFSVMRGTLLAREDKTNALLRRCALTESELKSRINQLSLELGQVQNTRQAAEDLRTRIVQEAKATRNKIFSAVLLLVLRDGWLERKPGHST